ELPEPIVAPLDSAPQVLGPTTPSTAMSAEDCRSVTAELVAGPKTPSTAIEAPAAFSRVCRVLTALPRSPWRSLGWDWDESPDPDDDPDRAPQVLGPTTPSTAMPAEDWWFLTACSVRDPKTPSTASDAPWSFSCCCRWETASPRAPRRSLTSAY